MSRFDLSKQPTPAPTAVSELAAELESKGTAAWYQGEGLIAALLGPAADSACSLPATRAPTQVLLCRADAPRLLQVLPRAVVTASDRRRLTLGTPAGPIDLIPLGDTPLEIVLPGFGLSALGFAWRPIDGRWCDPGDSRAALASGRLDVCADPAVANAFDLAPRRYWIAARLLAEHDLEAAPRMLEAARNVLAASLERLPEGASARRELQRVLTSRAPARGLDFLRAVGLSDALFPGINANGARIVGDLAPDVSLRWAAWLAGTSTQRALRKLRMPLRPARSIERLLRHHPIDRMIKPAGDAGLRRIRQRLSSDEISGLIAWRRIELTRSDTNQATDADRARLSKLESRLERLSAHRSATEQIKRLAIDGESVMRILDSGPGRHVGRALAHLAAFVLAEPAANEFEKLEIELRSWAALHPE